LTKPAALKRSLKIFLRSNLGRFSLSTAALKRWKAPRAFRIFRLKRNSLSIYTTFSFFFASRIAIHTVSPNPIAAFLSGSLAAQVQKDAGHRFHSLPSLSKTVIYRPSQPTIALLLISIFRAFVFRITLFIVTFYSLRHHPTLPLPQVSFRF